MPDLSNIQLVGRNGHDTIVVASPQAVMSVEEALVHAAWILLIADPGGDRFLKILASVTRKAAGIT